MQNNLTINKGYQLTPTMQRVADVLNELGIVHEVFGEKTISMCLTEDNVFVSTTIMESNNGQRLLYLARTKGLVFDNEIFAVVQDIISEINNKITYGHVSLGTVGDDCIALYKCYSPVDLITVDEIRFNLNACNYMVHKFFSSFEHLKKN